MSSVDGISPPPALHVALYGEVDPNVIDGSSVWLVSLIEVLALAGIRVSVVLRTAPQRDVLLGPVRALAGVSLIDPVARGWAERGADGRLDAGQAVAALRALDRADRFDLVIVRGSRTADAVGRARDLRGRLCAYLTDIPQPGDRWSLRRWLRIRRTARNAHRMLCQTPELEAHLLRLAPRARGKCMLLSPMIPDAAVSAGPRAAAPVGGCLRLVYHGKFARLWNTLDMTALPAALAARGQEAELVMIGDRFQPDGDPGFEPRMRAALGAPGVQWRQGQGREDAMTLAGQCHVGLSWRDRGMDGSVELSTKLLEYGALGVPAVCNPTPMHKRLFGADYPLFASTFDEVVAALAAVASDPALYAEAARRCHAVATGHRFSVAAEALRAGLGAVSDPR